MELLGSPVRTLVSIVLFMLAVIALATLAYMGAGWSFADASYMVLLTIYTVGYGEVHPITTPYLRGVTLSLMIVGCTGMIHRMSTPSARRRGRWGRRAVKVPSGVNWRTFTS